MIRRRLRIEDHDSRACFTADADRELGGLLTSHLTADDYAPQWRCASGRNCDAGFGEMARKNGAQGIGTGGVGEGSGLHGVIAGGRR